MLLITYGACKQLMMKELAETERSYLNDSKATQRVQIPRPHH